MLESTVARVHYSQRRLVKQVIQQRPRISIRRVAVQDGLRVMSTHRILSQSSLVSIQYSLLLQHWTMAKSKCDTFYSTTNCMYGLTASSISRTDTLEKRNIPCCHPTTIPSFSKTGDLGHEFFHRTHLTISWCQTIPAAHHGHSREYMKIQSCFSIETLHGSFKNEWPTLKSKI